jgi:hypothetical protein
MLVYLLFNVLFLLVKAVVPCFLFCFVLCIFPDELVLNVLYCFSQESEWSAELVNKHTNLSKQLYILIYFQLNSSNLTLKVLRTLDNIINFEQNLRSVVVCFLFIEPELCIFWEVLVLNLFNFDLSTEDVSVAHSVHQVNNKWLSVIFDIELKRLLKDGCLATLHICLHHFIRLVHHYETLLDLIPQIFSSHHKNFKDALQGLLAVTLGILQFYLVFLYGFVGIKDSLFQLQLSFYQLVFGVKVVVHKLVQLNFAAVVFVAF